MQIILVRLVAPLPAGGAVICISERWRAQSFDTDMAKLRYYGERNEAAPYLADRGWMLNGTTIRDLLAANDLPPLSDDDVRMGDMLYVSGSR